MFRWLMKSLLVSKFFKADWPCRRFPDTQLCLLNSLNNVNSLGLSEVFLSKVEAFLLQVLFLLFFFYNRNRHIQL